MHIDAPSDSVVARWRTAQATSCFGGLGRRVPRPLPCYRVRHDRKRRLEHKQPHILLTSRSHLPVGISADCNHGLPHSHIAIINRLVEVPSLFWKARNSKRRSWSHPHCRRWPISNDAVSRFQRTILLQLLQFHAKFTATCCMLLSSSVFRKVCLTRFRAFVADIQSFSIRSRSTQGTAATWLHDRGQARPHLSRTSPPCGPSPSILLRLILANAMFTQEWLDIIADLVCWPCEGRYPKAAAIRLIRADDRLTSNRLESRLDRTR